nr:DMT family transporter [Jannaschia sp. S6380]
MVAATALIAVTTLLAKALGTEVLGSPLPPVQVTFGRYLFGAVTILAIAAHLRPRLNPANAPWHALRVVCGWSGVTLLFAAAAAIPLAEATAITFLNPVLAMFLAIPLLGERPGPVRWGAAAIALAGAVLLLRPGAGIVAPGALLALAAACFLACEVMVIKRLTRNEALLATLIWANVLGLVLSCAAALPGWQPPTGSQWWALAALGVTMALAQILYVNALARGDASFVTPFSYLVLVFAGLYDAALFGVIPDAVGFAGAALILMGAALLAWREGRLRQGASAPAPFPTSPPRRPR